MSFTLIFMQKSFERLKHFLLLSVWRIIENIIIKLLKIKVRMYDYVRATTINIVSLISKQSDNVAYEFIYSPTKQPKQQRTDISHHVFSRIFKSFCHVYFSLG